MKELIETTLEEARQTLESFLEETTTVEVISQAASTCAGALKAGNKIISCGNGGSLCDATHFAEELTGRYLIIRLSANVFAHFGLLMNTEHITSVNTISRR